MGGTHSVIIPNNDAMETIGELALQLRMTQKSLQGANAQIRSLTAENAELKSKLKGYEDATTAEAEKTPDAT